MQAPIKDYTDLSKDLSNGAILNASPTRVSVYRQNIEAKLAEIKKRDEKITKIEDRIAVVEQQLSSIIDILQQMTRNNAAY